MIAPRSPVVALGVRAATPLALVVALYLLFAGHNNPGGGFAAGLVLGAVVTLRAVAGTPRNPTGRRWPLKATELIAGGIIIICLIAVVPLLWGEALLDQAVLSVELPILGKVKSGSALPFDIGVTAIVVGLVIALLDGLSVGDSGPRSNDDLPGARLAEERS